MAMDDAGDTRSTKRILIVDDDPATVRILRDVLGGFRHDHEYQMASRSTAPRPSRRSSAIGSIWCCSTSTCRA
jgi:CheY-like chemotaxis protein